MAATAELTDIRVEDLEKFKVADLKRELKARGLSVVGNKSELLDRLQVHLQAEPVDEEVVLNEDEVLREDEVLADDPKVDMALDTTPTLLTDESILVSTTTPTNGTTTPAVPKEKDHHPLVTAAKSPVAAEKKNPSPKVLSPSEALQLRAKRFNLPPTESAKKQVRAERFGSAGLAQQSNSSTAPKGPQSSEKLQQRADRFGLNAKKHDEEERIRKRKERFGAIVAAAAGDPDSAAKKKKRSERFGSL